VSEDCFIESLATVFLLLQVEQGWHNANDQPGK